MQVVDIAALKVDLAVGGIDQRNIHMLAREEMPKLGPLPPVCLHTPIISGLKHSHPNKRIRRCQSMCIYVS
jgi:tyrosyl-tRNA synthetase